MDRFAKKTYRIDCLLEETLREYGLDHKVLEAKVFTSWRETVGELVARHTQPISLVNGRLTVNVSHNVWITELLLLRERIIGQINAAVRKSAVKELQFFVKPITQSLCPAIQRPQGLKRLTLEKVELTPDTLEQIDRTIAGVTDPDLKERLKRIFIKQCQRSTLENQK